MAKMIERMLLRFRLSGLGRLRSQKNMIESYLPIREEIVRQRSARAIQWMEFLHEAKMAPLGNAAGRPTATVAAAREAKVQALRDRYRLKEKALAQTRKRAEAKGPLSPEAIAGFEESGRKLVESRDRRIAAILAPSRRSSLSEAEALRKFLEVETEQTEILARKKAALRAKEEKHLDAIRKRAARQIAHLDGKIAALRKMVLERHPAQTGDADLPENVLLRLQNLSMRFGGLLAVDNLSFDVKQGEIFGLIGPNGAGKTTIFNCITRFYRPTSGEMYYRRNAVEVIRLNDFPVHQIIRQGIVRTFQNVELVWELSVLDNLLVAAHTVYRSGFFAQLLHTPGLRREENVLKAKALGVLQTLGLSAYAYAFPYGLPYGILKKIELARTLMANPRLIILDEPAAGLNDKETEELAVLIRKIRDDYKCTIFLVEHDMGLVMDICDTVCAISFGRMLAIGTPAAIQADPLVRAAYLGEAS
ncbi:MAG TPA: ATP-binding cassette domain-containing protein [Candidatus Izemoplasmatales bacterium]|nr:ATP-binding cassette domain-containing protein [Candidatus Izemoplasmatales bacterium]